MTPCHVLDWRRSIARRINAVAGIHLTCASTAFASPPGFTNGETRTDNAQAGGSGIPSRAPDLDVLPGFRNPPSGYGQVPFWCWTGDKLDTDRMIGQLKELHKKGVSGVQVNYSHYDTPGWLTDQDEPEIISEAWWDVYSKISKVDAERLQPPVTNTN